MVVLPFALLTWCANAAASLKKNRKNSLILARWTPFSFSAEGTFYFASVLINLHALVAWDSLAISWIRSDSSKGSTVTHGTILATWCLSWTKIKLPSTSTLQTAQNAQTLHFILPSQSLDIFISWLYHPNIIHTTYFIHNGTSLQSTCQTLFILINVPMMIYNRLNQWRRRTQSWVCLFEH